MAELQFERSEEALARALGDRESVILICYAPFGIVRGTLHRHSLVAPADASAVPHVKGERSGKRRFDRVIELHDAIVEHHSSHLPTGLHKTFFLKLDRLSAFLIVD
ncbi:MAG: hypothetical protein ABI882_07495 [Acidobacteriota bacterium]